MRMVAMEPYTVVSISTGVERVIHIWEPLTQKVLIFKMPAGT